MDITAAESPIAPIADVNRLADTLAGLGLGAADALTVAGHALTGGKVGEQLFALGRAGAIDSPTMLAAYRACRAAV